VRQLGLGSSPIGRTGKDRGGGGDKGSKRRRRRKLHRLVKGLSYNLEKRSLRRTGAASRVKRSFSCCGEGAAGCTRGGGGIDLAASEISLKNNKKAVPAQGVEEGSGYPSRDELKKKHEWKLPHPQRCSADGCEGGRKGEELFQGNVIVKGLALPTEGGTRGRCRGVRCELGDGSQGEET